LRWIAFKALLLYPQDVVDKKNKDTFSCIFAFTKNIAVDKMWPKDFRLGLLLPSRSRGER
jgi:hypothetical protein